MSTRVVHLRARVAEPVVTVVIPTRNRPAFLRRCLATVLGQAGVDLEVIVVDDGSDVPLAAQLELALVLADPRVRIVRFDQSRGVAAARNEGIDRARGRWTAFVDDDDVWAENKLSAQMAALREAPGSVWSCTGEVHLGIGLNVFGVVLPPTADQVVERLYRSNSVPGGGSSVVASTQKLKDLGGFDPDFAILADWEMWIRLAELSPPAVVAKPLVGYLRHLGGMSLDRRSSWREIQRLEAKHHRQMPGRVRVDRFGYYVYLGQREFQLNRPRRGAGFLLRAAVSRPDAPLRLAPMVTSALSRRLRRSRPRPAEFKIGKSELERQLEHWRSADHSLAPELVTAGGKGA